jgi:TolB protein
MIDALGLIIRRAHYTLGAMLTFVRRYAEWKRSSVFSCCLLAFATVGASNGAAATDQKLRERMFYISMQPGNLDIYSFSKPGAQPRRLTTDFGLDYNATISPDGHWLVFTSERNGNPHLYVLDLKKGGDPRPLIQSEFMEDQAVISPDGKTIAFVGTRDGTADIFTLPFDPKQIQDIARASNLTHDPGGEFRPAFSPDGHMIAFSSDRDTPVTGPADARVREGHIYVMDSKGKHWRRLTHSQGWDGSPTWSKDGKRIFFYSTTYSASNFTTYPLIDNQSRIWVVDVNGESLRPISAPNEVAFSPTLTLEGRVAYSVQTGVGEHARWKVMSVEQDGSSKRQESDTSADYYKPVFDPVTGAMFCHGSGPTKLGIAEGPSFPGMQYLGQGPFLVHGSPRQVSLPDRELELYPVRAFSVIPHPHKSLLASTIPSSGSTTMMLTDISGSDIRKITRLQSTDLPWQQMSWSPDGKWIAFTQGAVFARPPTEADIWKIHPDGTGAVNLTPNSPGNDGSPSFSGDNRRIAFRSGRTGNYNIYVMNSDGTDVKRLTYGQSHDNFPAFSPLNDEIAFSSDRDGELDPKTGRRTFEIYTLKVSPDGTPGELRRITYSHGQNAHPQYSPDGQWLVFTSERMGLNDEQPLVNIPIFSPQPYADLYAYRLKDGTLIRLTNNKWEDGLAYWASPTD